MNEHGKVSFQVEPGITRKLPQPMHFNIWVPNFMLVYANFIEYSSIGHIAAPVLKVIPLELVTSEKLYRFYESKKMNCIT